MYDENDELVAWVVLIGLLGAALGLSIFAWAQGVL